MNKAIKLWGMPVLMVLFTLFGLLAALNGTGIWHWLSWCALGIPAAAMMWYICKAGVFKK